MPNAKFVGKQRTRQSLFQKVSILTPYLPAILLFGGSKFWQDTFNLRQRRSIVNFPTLHHRNENGKNMGSRNILGTD
jgi:hypothetical protein